MFPRPGIYLRRLLFLRYLFAIQGFRLLYNDKSMQIPDNMSPARIFGSSKRRRLELYPILVRDTASMIHSVMRVM